MEFVYYSNKKCAKNMLFFIITLLFYSYGLTLIFLG